MRRTTLALLLALAIPAGAAASLGGTVATVEADRVQMRSALVRVSRADAYSVHEILTPTGTTIREYYSTAGVVFGVAWDGEWPPDLRQLLGTYFDQYLRSVQANRRRTGTRGQVSIDEGGLVVRAGGHARSVSGIAYAPALLPAGVGANVVK